MVRSAGRVSSVSGPVSSSAGGPCDVALIQSLSNQGLDDRLAAHVQFFRGILQFFQHRSREVYIHALDGLPHLAGIGEKPRDILTAVRHSRNALGRRGPLLTRRVLHKVFVLLGSLSIGSPDGSTPLPRLRESHRSLNKADHPPSQSRDAEQEDRNAGRHNRDGRKPPVPPRNRFRVSDSAAGSCSSAHRSETARWYNCYITPSVHFSA